MFRTPRSLILALSFAIAGWSTAASAAVKLPAVIGSDMVLQQGVALPIWGWADKGEDSDRQRCRANRQRQSRRRWPLESVAGKARSHARSKAAGDDRQGLVRRHDHAQEHPHRRSLGLLRPVEHGDGHRGRQRRRRGNQGGRFSSDSPVHRAEAEGPRTGEGCEIEVGGMQPEDGRRRRLGRLLRGGLLFRPRFAQGAEGARRTDSHFMGRHAGRTVDQQEIARCRADVERHGRPGRKLPALQRHDRSADSVRDPRRDLVSGRSQCRPRAAIQSSPRGHDPQLAHRLGPRRFPVRNRANRSVQIRQRRHSRSRALGIRDRHRPFGSQRRRRLDHGHRRAGRHPSERQARRRTPPGAVGSRHRLWPEDRILRTDV